MANLANVRVKPVKIVLDKERNLLFDFNAFSELEDVYGSAEKAFDKLQKGSIKALRTLLWAGLVHEDESLTEKAVGKMLGLADVKYVSEKITDALKVSAPEPEAETKN